MNKRRQYLIDRRTQFKIAGQLVALWFAGIAIVAGFPLFAMLMYGGIIAKLPMPMIFEQIFDAVWFPLMMALIVVPLGVWYSFRFSNRLAGPIFRVNREITRLAGGIDSCPVTLREGDFFKELAESFNGLREQVLRLESRNRLLEANLQGMEPGGPASEATTTGLPVTGPAPEPGHSPACAGNA